MADMICGYFVSQIVRAFADMSLADHLTEQPLTADELSSRENSDPGTTYRLMRGGVALGLVNVDSDGRFHATELLGTLRKDTPGSLRAMALGATNTSHWSPWSQFPAAVRKGSGLAAETLGAPGFEYLQRNPIEAQEFTDYMQSTTSLWTRDAASVIDTSTVKTAVDVGGANGSLLRLLQDANPQLHGIVFDRPDVAEALAVSMHTSKFADRTGVVGGDFFDSIPEGDLLLLKFILHDWDDDACVRILRCCRDALRPGGRVALIEMVVGWDANPGVAALMDLNMLAVTDGGRERSLGEYDALFSRAGLVRNSVRSMNSPQSVIEAVAV
jgi:hypothetical protein